MCIRDSCHYVRSTQFGYLTFFEAFQTRFGLFSEQYIIRRVVEDLLHVLSLIHISNKPSQRVMQKIGMEFEKNFMHPSVTDGHPLKEHVLYKSLL